MAGSQPDPGPESEPALLRGSDGEMEKSAALCPTVSVGGRYDLAKGSGDFSALKQVQDETRDVQEVSLKDRRERD